MQKDCLSQKIQHYTLQCHSSLLCAATLSAHSLALAGIYSSQRGLQRLRGRSSQQRGSAGQLLCQGGAMLSMTWAFTGPGHTWAFPYSLSGCCPYPKSHCSMGKARCSQQAKLYHQESTKATFRLRRQVRAAAAGFLIMWPGIGLVSLRWQFLF